MWMRQKTCRRYSGTIREMNFQATLAGATTIAVLGGWPPTPAAASGGSYDDMRSAAVKRCEAIDPSQYQTALFFNPDGYRSYYVRSSGRNQEAFSWVRARSPAPRPSNVDSQRGQRRTKRAVERHICRKRVSCGRTFANSCERRDVLAFRRLFSTNGYPCRREYRAWGPSSGQWAACGQYYSGFLRSLSTAGRP